MPDSVKRMNAMRNKQFQDKCRFYFYLQSNVVFGQGTDADTNDSVLAKAVWANQVNAEDMARIVMTNATIGAAIDNGETVTDSDVEYAVQTENRFHDLAQSYAAAGLI